MYAQAAVYSVVARRIRQFHSPRNGGRVWWRRRDRWCV